MSKTLTKINLLGRARAFLSEQLCLSLYKSFVLLMFDFKDFVYDCLSSKNAFKLQKLQNTAFRSILRQDKRTSMEYMHNQVSMPYLNVRCLKHSAIEMYKVFHLLAPPIICQHFEYVEDVSTACT